MGVRAFDAEESAFHEKRGGVRELRWVLSEVDALIPTDDGEDTTGDDE